MNVLFVMNVHKEFELALCTATRIKDYYPTASLLIVFDDTINDCPTKIYDCLVRLGWLFNNKSGYRHNTRFYLNLATTVFNRDYIVKLDPDTYVKGTFNFNSLDKDCLHCNFNPDEKHGRYIFGGLIVYPYKIAKEIVESELLDDEKYNHKKFNYTNRKTKQQTPCQDKIIYDVVYSLGIRMCYVVHFANISLKPLNYLEEGYYFQHGYNEVDKTLVPLL